NQANAETTITRGSGSPDSSTFALHAFGGPGFSGLYGNSANIGVYGFTTDMTGLYSGVWGVAGAPGSNFLLSAGVHGSSLLHPGVIGDSDSSSGVVGLQGGLVTPPAGSIAGVLGVAPAGVHAVQGVAGGVGPLPPIGTVGVGGYSGTGIGAVGTATSNHGVY